MLTHKLTCALATAGALLYLTPARAEDKKAGELAKAMMTAMGGADGWSRAHFVRYDFKVNAGGKTVVARSHLWDKYTGRYRIDGKNKEGQPTVVLFNSATKEGTAYVNGKKLEGAAAAKDVKDAYAAFINDMYWLAMPWKWMDQGVNLKYLGSRELHDKAYDVVQLTFGKVGLTPGDRYEAWVSPDSHLMEHWNYTLQSGNKGSWDWEYTTTGGIKLASNHKSADGKMSINMGTVKVMDSVPDAVFTDPSSPLPQ